MDGDKQVKESNTGLKEQNGMNDRKQRKSAEESSVKFLFTMIFVGVSWYLATKDGSPEGLASGMLIFMMTTSIHLISPLFSDGLTRLLGGLFLAADFFVALVPIGIMSKNLVLIGTKASDYTVYTSTTSIFGPCFIFQFNTFWYFVLFFIWFQLFLFWIRLGLLSKKNKKGDN